VTRAVLALSASVAAVPPQVACQAAPATLKAAYLEPVSGSMATEVALQLFAQTDAEYMQLFTGVWRRGGVRRGWARATRRARQHG
jgi:hypothetical protein